MTNIVNMVFYNQERTRKVQPTKWEPCFNGWLSPLWRFIFRMLIKNNQIKNTYGDIFVYKKLEIDKGKLTEKIVKSIYRIRKRYDIMPTEMLVGPAFFDDLTENLEPWEYQAFFTIDIPNGYHGVFHNLKVKIIPYMEGFLVL